MSEQKTPICVILEDNYKQYILLFNMDELLYIESTIDQLPNARYIQYLLFTLAINHGVYFKSLNWSLAQHSILDLFFEWTAYTIGYTSLSTQVYITEPT